MTPSEQTRDAVVKIVRDAREHCIKRAMIFDDMHNDDAARDLNGQAARLNGLVDAILAMPIPAESAALAALADDMAKALEPFSKGWDDAVAQFPNGGTMAVIGIVAGNSVSGVHYRQARAALDRFRAAKKEQA